jgi:hypothetical protein
VHRAAKYKALIGSRDLGKGRSIDQSEFFAKMNLANERIGGFLSRMIDMDGSDGIDFNWFVIGLNKFHPKMLLND